MKRLGIYVIYDREGIIDDYIPYYLNALSPHLAHLVIVCNGKLSDAGRQRLLPFTKDIFVRSNDGYDAGAVKETLEHLYGWDEVLKYDELLISNDTFYGPLFPLAPCFGEMDKREVDFWGMTKQGEFESSSQRLPSHIQSYFLNVKKRLLHSRNFRAFWERLEASHAIHETIRQYEVGFTTTFAEQGFAWDVYVETGPMISRDASDNYNYSLYDPVNLIEKCGCPLVKRKAFAYRSDYDMRVVGNERKNELIRLIEEKTTYGVDMIWDNLLRTSDMQDIVTTLHLHYVMSTGKQAADSLDACSKRLVVVVAHLASTDMLQASVDYLLRVPSDFELVVTTSSAEITRVVRASIERAGVHLIENVSSGMESLLLSRPYIEACDYLCFVSDEAPVEIRSKEREAESYHYLLWENTLASDSYIERMLELFGTNRRLGYLTVPRPYHGHPFAKFGSSTMFAMGNAFWCRTSAIRKALEQERDWDAVSAEERGRVFVQTAQAEGYYSGVTMSERYAAVRNVDLERIVSYVMERVRSHRSFDNYEQFFSEALRFDQEMLRECKRLSKLYIYGAGEFAGHVAGMLQDEKVAFEAFIVSDGKAKPNTYCGYPVIYLSEVPAFDSSMGVVLGLDRRNRAEVMPILSAHGTPVIITLDL